MRGWAWDDEDAATPPHVHVYGDDRNGDWCAFVLPYTTSEERDEIIEFVRLAVSALNRPEGESPARRGLGHDQSLVTPPMKPPFME